MVKYWGLRNIISSLCLCPLDLPRAELRQESDQILSTALECCTLVVKVRVRVRWPWTLFKIRESSWSGMNMGLSQTRRCTVGGQTFQTETQTCVSSWWQWGVRLCDMRKFFENQQDTCTKQNLRNLALMVLGNIQPFRVSWNLPKIDRLLYMTYILLCICHLAWI